METKETIEGPFLYLQVTSSRDCGDAWNIYPVKTVNGKIRNYSRGAWEREPLSDFSIHVYFDKKESIEIRAPAERSAIMYGWGATYRNVFEVDEGLATVMLKTLKAINKNLEAQAATYGQVHSFSDFVLRVAVAIKAKGFVRVSEEGSGYSYDHSLHTFMDAGQARYYIEGVHADYLEKLFPTPQESAA